MPLQTGETPHEADKADTFAAEVLEKIESLSLEVADIAGTIDGLAKFVKHQEELFAHLKSIAHTMADAIRSIDTAGHETRDVTARAGQQSNESLHTIDAALADINRLVGSVQGIEQRLEELEGALGEVSSRSRDIQKIARQTNLLALNATIEAARAGEAGKGFAVVANEVKSLANQTARATEEIAQQINAVQDQTRTVVDAIRGIGDVIDEVSSIAQAIAAAVEQQSAATQEIARNVEQAATGTADVTNTITGVQQAAGDTGAAAGTVLDAARLLANQAGELRQAVDGFLNDVKNA